MWQTQSLERNCDSFSRRCATVTNSSSQVDAVFKPQSSAHLKGYPKDAVWSPSRVSSIVRRCRGFWCFSNSFQCHLAYIFFPILYVSPSADTVSGCRHCAGAPRGEVLITVDSRPNKVTETRLRRNAWYPSTRRWSNS